VFLTVSLRFAFDMKKAKKEEDLLFLPEPFLNRKILKGLI